VAGKVSRAKAPDHTHKEAEYLRLLIGEKLRVRLVLTDGHAFEGIVEFFDTTFIRLTRDGEPNLFIYKQDMKYLCELEKPSGTTAVDIPGGEVEA
jgi:host factor-I protein